jgi:2Fe-2S ferredoxin
VGSVAGTVRLDADTAIEFAVNDGESIMAAAQRCGWRWPTVCHGQGECTACWFAVLAGAANLDAPRPHELETLQLLPSLLRATGTTRLACQTTVRGDVVIRKRGVRAL